MIWLPLLDWLAAFVLIVASPWVRWESWGRIRCWLWVPWWPRSETESCTTVTSQTWVCWHTWGLWRTGALKRSTFWFSWKSQANDKISLCLYLSPQMRAVISGVMRKNRARVEHLSPVDLATFGHLLCGLYPAEIKRLSPYNLRSAWYPSWVFMVCTLHFIELLKLQTLHGGCEASSWNKRQQQPMHSVW